MIKLKKIKNN